GGAGAGRTKGGAGSCKWNVRLRPSGAGTPPAIVTPVTTVWWGGTHARLRRLGIDGRKAVRDGAAGTHRARRGRLHRDRLVLCHGRAARRGAEGESAPPPRGPATRPPPAAPPSPRHPPPAPH